MSWVSYLCKKKLQNSKTVGKFLWWIPVDTIICLFYIKISFLRIFSNDRPLSYRLIILILNTAFDDM
jgi:hypothetical protein